MGGAVDDIVSVGTLGLVDTDFAGDEAAKASRRAANQQAQAGEAAIVAQREAAQRAQGFFQPFQGAAERGIEASSFLANPQAQFDFLQSNPLFNLSLENANRQTQQAAASRGRLNAGDTLQQLSNNVLLASTPLIDRQRQDVNNLLNLGTGVATSQANIETGQAANIADLTTGIGAAQAAGTVGAANARTAGTQQLLDIGTTAGLLAFSDERLKTNKVKIGEKSGRNWYSWDWNELAGEIMGLFGSSEGVMAQEVLKTNPEAVVMDETGYYKVNYGAL